MQPIPTSGDSAIAHTPERSFQLQMQASLTKRPQLTAKWEIVNGKLQCYWTLT